jgi:hypothetical protein
MQGGRRIVITFLVLAVILVLLQLQPALIHMRGGVAGSFGLRPMTHACLGWVGPADRFAWLPYTDFEFRLGWFHYRYSYTKDHCDSGTPMCLGQDIWFGE